MKYTPIPESLGYCDLKWPHHWKPLPPDLDRLFRMSPALAGICEDVRDELRTLLKRIEEHPNLKIDALDAQIFACVHKLGAALALLEE